LEIGTKDEFFDHRLGISLSIYNNQYEDMQLRAGVPTGGAITTNAAASRIRGGEFELTARPTESLTLTGNAAYTEANFTRFPTAHDIFDKQVDATGLRLPRTPRWQYFFSAAQDFTMDDGSKLTVEGNFRWRGRIYFYFTNQSPTLWSPWQDGAGDELGAQISWRDSSRQWKVSLYGTNLTDSRIINVATTTFSYPEVGFNKPRIVGISLERLF
jgi:iron complex outermembrane receptor protein